MPTVRIPFTIPDVSDTDEAEGFLYLEDDYLVVEYTVKKFGIFRKATRMVKADRTVIVALELRKGLFGDRLVIETSSMQLLREVPGKHVTGVEVRTRRSHREAVQRFIERVHAWVDRAGPVPRA